MKTVNDPFRKGSGFGTYAVGATGNGHLLDGGYVYNKSGNAMLTNALDFMSLHLNGTSTSKRNEEKQFDFDAILLAGDFCIAEAVPAFIMVELGLDRFPAGIPSGVSVVDV